MLSYEMCNIRPKSFNSCVLCSGDSSVGETSSRSGSGSGSSFSFTFSYSFIFRSSVRCSCSGSFRRSGRNFGSFKTSMKTGLWSGDGGHFQSSTGGHTAKQCKTQETWSKDDISSWLAGFGRDLKAFWIGDLWSEEQQRGRKNERISMHSDNMNKTFRCIRAAWIMKRLPNYEENYFSNYKLPTLSRTRKDEKVCEGFIWVAQLWWPH